MKTLCKICTAAVLLCTLAACQNQGIRPSNSVETSSVSQVQETLSVSTAQAFGIPQGVEAENFASQLCETVRQHADGTWTISQVVKSQAPKGMITIVDCRKGFLPSPTACNVFAFTSGVRAVNCGDRIQDYDSYVVAGVGASSSACENAGRHIATCFHLFH